MCSQTRYNDRYGSNGSQKDPKGGAEMSVNKECNNFNTISSLNMQMKGGAIFTHKSVKITQQGKRSYPLKGERGTHSVTVEGKVPLAKADKGLDGVMIGHF